MRLHSRRREPPLPHDLYQRQVQSEYWTTGVFLGHLGPPGDHVRHAGSGEDAHTHTHLYTDLALTDVCVFDAARVGDFTISKHREELLSA